MDKVWAKAEARRAYMREYFFRWRYGITKEQFKQLAKSQGNVCAICRRPRVLVPDHDHRTKIVRAALCNKCNRGIGFLEENHAILVGAIRYLKHHNSRSKSIG